MHAEPAPAFARRATRSAMALAHANGMLWSLGNGLVSTSLVVYFALALGAKGIGVGLIVAAPQFAGVLRLAAPALLAQFPRKGFCLAMFAASTGVLLGLPILASPGVLPSPAVSLAALVGLWSIYHLFQYLATVALWSWLGEIAPPRICGRFLGHRERWMLAGSILSMLASGLFSYVWRRVFPELEWLAYAIPAALGAACMLAALVPLAQLAATPGRAMSETMAAPRPFALSDLTAPLASRPFLGFLAFGCWFSFTNGLTQSPQYYYPANILAFSLFTMLVFQAGTRLGQLAISPRIGAWCDRLGNRRVLAVSQLVAAGGLLFYAAATPAQPWWLAGAWVAWIAFAGLNVGLPNLMLRLAPRESSAPAIAMYFAATSLAFGVSTVLGGWVFDRWGKTPGFFATAFVMGWLVRSAGVAWLWFVEELEGD
jgi:hypothetical protein